MSSSAWLFNVASGRGALDRITVVCALVPGFLTWVLEIQIQIVWLVEQLLYTLEASLSPTSYFLVACGMVYTLLFLCDGFQLLGSLSSHVL